MGNANLELYSLNLASSLLSLFGCIAIIINYVFFATKSQPLYKLIVFLSLADLGGSVTISVSQILILLHYEDGLAYGILMCKIFRAFINFFFVSSFFWTSGIALHTYVSTLQLAQIPMYWFHIVAWGVPAVMTGLLVGLNMIVQEQDGGQDTWCTDSKTGYWLFWYGPLLFSFAFCAVAYLLIILHYRKVSRDRKLRNKVKLRVTLYLFVFFICWVWDLANFAISQYIHSPQWLNMLTSTFMPLQGFLNFLVYGVSSRMFRHARGTKTSSRLSINYKEERRKLIAAGDM